MSSDQQLYNDVNSWVSSQKDNEQALYEFISDDQCGWWVGGLGGQWYVERKWKLPTEI